MHDLVIFITAKLNYWVYIVLMMVGLYAMIAKNNLVKKVIGMNILQTAVILFLFPSAPSMQPRSRLLNIGMALNSRLSRR